MENAIESAALLLADKFAAEIRAAASPEELREIIRRNRENPTGCATHDFMDSNMQMETAWREFMGRDLDVQSEFDCELWNRAWTIAREREFAARD